LGAVPVKPKSMAPGVKTAQPQDFWRLRCPQ